METKNGARNIRESCLLQLDSLRRNHPTTVPNMANSGMIPRGPKLSIASPFKPYIREDGQTAPLPQSASVPASTFGEGRSGQMFLGIRIESAPRYVSPQRKS